MTTEIEKLQETIKNHDRMAQTLPAPHRMTYIIKAREARAQLAELKAQEPVMLTVIHIPTGDVMGQFETTQAARQWIKMGDVEDWGDFRTVDANGQEVQLPFMNTPRI